ncbi:MAG: ThuA domain-containing protein [Kiritimatiellales bacterium]|nr:ThuA domain-containing protein [Kiritimatiellales bacterium]
MKRRILLAAVAAVLVSVGCVSAAPKLKTLIIDGRNNHDWETTTPQLRLLLEETGRFAVDVATAPPKGEPLDGFKPDFSKYDVLVMNYAEFKLPVARWPRATETAFLDFVRNGGGVVIFHAADNAFPNWPEYNEIIGVGGWGGRTEKDGPMIRWRDGKMVLVDEPGKAGQHGPKAPFQIVTTNPDHPITKGLPQKWMHTADELYSTLRGPAKNVTLLAAAYADPAKPKGTGEYEPILFTIAYGKGRVFHTVLGHSATQGMDCVGFACTLQRGTEWAATGKVTLPVPADFPTADKTSSRN